VPQPAPLEESQKHPYLKLIVLGLRLLYDPMGLIGSDIIGANLIEMATLEEFAYRLGYVRFVTGTLNFDLALLKVTVEPITNRQPSQGSEPATCELALLGESYKVIFLLLCFPPVGRLKGLPVPLPVQ